MCSLHTWNKCSLSNTTWHLTLPYLALNSLGMIFQFLPCQSTTSYLMNCSCGTVSVQDCDYTSAKQTHFNYFFSSWRANMLSLQLQQAFTVKQYLASHPYITCKNQFWGEFSNYHVPHKWTVSCLVNCLHDTNSMQDRKCSCQALVSYDNMDNICHTLLCSPRRMMT